MDSPYCTFPGLGTKSSFINVPLNIHLRWKMNAEESVDGAKSSFSPAGPQLSTGEQASCCSAAIKPAADIFIAACPLRWEESMRLGACLST